MKNWKDTWKGELIVAIICFIISSLYVYGLIQIFYLMSRDFYVSLSDYIVAQQVGFWILMWSRMTQEKIIKMFEKKK